MSAPSTMTTTTTTDGQREKFRKLLLLMSELSTTTTTTTMDEEGEKISHLGGRSNVFYPRTRAKVRKRVRKIFVNPSIFFGKNPILASF